MKLELKNLLKSADGDLKSQLMLIFAKYPKLIMQIVKNDRVFGLKERIRAACEKLVSETYTDLTRVHWILNGLTDFPACELCGKPLENVNVRSLSAGYGKIQACCARHMHRIRFERVSAANVAKHGAANPFQFMKDEIRRKNVAKYGNACPANAEEIRKEIRKKNLEIYGREAYQSTDEFREKIRRTSLERYGVACPLTAPEQKEKARKTNLERYGVEHGGASETAKAKRKKTMIAKYGENYGRAVWGNRGNAWQNRRAYGFMLNSSIAKPLFSENEYVDARRNDVFEFEFECLECGRRFRTGWDNGKPSRKCPGCGFAGGTSGIEKEIVEFARSTCGAEVRTNDRSLIAPLELDAYVEDRKLAIELDGLYWHNDDAKPDYRYHLNKTEACEKLGVQLVHVFDCEWLNKRAIVESRLKDLFGIHDRTVYARKCRVEEVDKETARRFLDENHIQGSVGSSVRLGLYSGDELVSLMTFGKPRFSKKYEWEMLRFCSRLNCAVPGAAGKLLKYFEKTYSPESLVSYADRRWSRGGLYRALGFRLDHVSNPDYWYFKKNSTLLESRVKYQKRRLKDVLEKFDENLTEVENMKNNGYFRIFDCGNLVFLKKYN